MLGSKFARFWYAAGSDYFPGKIPLLLSKEKFVHKNITMLTKTYQ